MRFWVQIFFWGVGIPLQVLTLSALLRGWYRQFPFLFAYMIALLVAVLIEVPIESASLLDRPVAAREPAYYYWINEVLLQVLMFLLVVSLIYYATSQLRSRKLLRTALIGAPLAGAVIALAAEHRTGVLTGEWIIPWLRDLNFGSAVLDLLLWGLLITKRDKNYKLLMISGALGIQFTGEAIGGAIRTLAVQARSTTWAYVGAILIGLADMTCVYIWWQTFRRPPHAEGIAQPRNSP